MISHLAVLDPEKKFERLIFPTKYVYNPKKFKPFSLLGQVRFALGTSGRHYAKPKNINFRYFG